MQFLYRTYNSHNNYRRLSHGTTKLVLDYYGPRSLTLPPQPHVAPHGLCGLRVLWTSSRLPD